LCLALFYAMPYQEQQRYHQRRLLITQQGLGSWRGAQSDYDKLTGPGEISSIFQLCMSEEEQVAIFRQYGSQAEIDFKRFNTRESKPAAKTVMGTLKPAAKTVMGTSIECDADDDDFMPNPFASKPPLVRGVYKIKAADTKKASGNKKVSGNKKTAVTKKTGNQRVSGYASYFEGFSKLLG